MSYPTNRSPRDRQHSHFEEDDQERGVEQRGRSYMGERDQEFRERRPGDREPREAERFGERRYFDPYSGRNLGGDDDDRRREYSSRQQQGYAPYPYGEERGYRHLEDWQRPWQMGEDAAYESRSRAPSQQRSYGSRGDETASRSNFAPSGHRGRGPKGYQRSDERLREDICERLTEDPHIDASELTVEVANGEVTISGTVPDRRMKRAAEDLVEECSGVKQVHNALRVDSARGRANDDERFAGSTRPETRH
jgi:osmotically-inducible protein OsmY